MTTRDENEALASLLPSSRLRMLAHRVVSGVAMADIGTDHALLPAALVRAGIVPRAIATDRVRGPLAAAARTASTMAVELDLRCGDGLRVLEPGEVGTVVIAGMGGHRTMELVDAVPAVTARLDRLVLAPNNGWPGVRRWLAERGWAVEHEDMVEEADKYYVVWSVAPSRPAVHGWSDDDLELGPRLRRERPPAFVGWVRARVQSLRRALEQARLDGSTNDPRVVELERRLQRFVEAGAGR